jgi:putative transposase
MIRRWICCRRSRGETARRDASLPHDDRCGSFLWRARVPAGRWDMTSDPSNSLPARSRPAHPPVRELGNRSMIVFVTVCTSGRQPVLANPVIHGFLRESWERAGHWLVGRYVVMPDHIHLFCAPGKNPPEPIRSWISYWKRLVAFSQGGSIWQKNYWDTQLRRHESYEAKWAYVYDNPVRAGLVAQADAWPYRGELNILRWHA